MGDRPIRRAPSTTYSVARLTLEVRVPYGLCVISGAVAGFVSMAVLFHADSPRATPMPVADLPLASSVAAPTSITLHRNADLMFDNAPGITRDPAVRVEGPKTTGVTLPIGERVTVYFGTETRYRTGTLEGADADWVQLWLPASDSRVWIARENITRMETTEAARDSASH